MDVKLRRSKQQHKNSQEVLQEQWQCMQTRTWLDGWNKEAKAWHHRKYFQHMQGWK